MARKRRRYGWAQTIECGRKFCTRCGRWRHVCDFQCERRGEDGDPCLSTRCTTCLRLGWRESFAQREIRERRREYQRIWTQTKRREAGVAPRRWGKDSHRRTESTRHEVPVEPFHDAFLASGVPVKTLARRMDADERAVSRMLGLTPRTHTDPRYDKKTATRISYANALAITDALGLDRVEMGV